MASDQSETSGGSRARHLGLYRSIDSRTEEFLRLSRRRQMRQGCACAAISTAITVTIIVGALLLFEYNVVTNEENKPQVPNWHNLLNDTAEAMSLNTLKMLPIIIKELNKNKIETTTESTTKHQNPEKRHTTEFSYKKNVFSNRKNWIRLPTSKIYAIEYKTPPIAYFKTPKNDYFTKIRKIRDYQRIINYVDKMISDRVAFGSTQPMQTSEDYVSDDSPTQRMPSKKLARTSNDIKDPSMPNTSSNTEKSKMNGNKSKNCNCPNKIGDILSDLVSNIKLLVPHSNMTESPNEDLQSDMLTPFIENKEFTPSANTHALKGEIVKGLLNQNLKLRHYEKPSTYTAKPMIGSLSSLGNDKTDGRTVFGLLQQKITGEKTYFFKGFLKNATVAPPTFEITESYKPLHFIAPAYGEDSKRNLGQKFQTSDKVFVSTSKEQYAHVHDPLRFNANTQDEDEEDNNKNEDYKVPPEQIMSTPASRLNFANNYPLHFIANTRDYEDSSVKINYKKMTPLKELSIPTLRILANTPKYRMRYDDKNLSLQEIITASTPKIYHTKMYPSHGTPNAMDYEEDTKRNIDKGMSADKSYDEGADDGFVSKKNIDQKYLKPISPFNDNMNKTDSTEQPHNEKNILSPEQNNLNKTLEPNKDIKLSYKNQFYPMITTHFLYHRHNITTTPPHILDSIKTTTQSPTTLVQITTSITPINVEDTTARHVNTFNFTSDLVKTKNRGNNLPHNYQKFKDDTGFRFEELNLDDDFDKIINEDNYQEMNEKDDFMSTSFSNIETQTKQSTGTTAKSDLQSTTDSRDKDDVFFTSSVFHNKPRSYLEIQRNYLNEN